MYPPFRRRGGLRPLVGPNLVFPWSDFLDEHCSDQVGHAPGIHPTDQERAAAALTLSTERGFTVFLAWGTILRGWALAQQGQEAEGIAQIRQGLAAFRATGGRAVVPYHLAPLAEAYGQGG